MNETLSLLWDSHTIESSLSIDKVAANSNSSVCTNYQLSRLWDLEQWFRRLLIFAHSLASLTGEIVRRMKRWVPVFGTLPPITSLSDVSIADWWFDPLVFASIGQTSLEIRQIGHSCSNKIHLETILCSFSVVEILCLRNEGPFKLEPNWLAKPKFEMMWDVSVS